MASAIACEPGVCLRQWLGRACCIRIWIADDPGCENKVKMENDHTILPAPGVTRGAAVLSGPGFALVDVIYASAIAAVAVLVLYSTIMIGYAMINANQQRLDAEALAFDKTLEIFNTYDFSGVALATNLPSVFPPAGASVLPTNSEIRVMIAPNAGTPYKWDVEVRVKRDRFWPGGKTVALTNDVVYRVTRYAIGRN